MLRIFLAHIPSLLFLILVFEKIGTLASASHARSRLSSACHAHSRLSPACYTHTRLSRACHAYSSLSPTCHAHSCLSPACHAHSCLSPACHAHSAAHRCLSLISALSVASSGVVESLAGVMLPLGSEQLLWYSRSPESGCRAVANSCCGRVARRNQAAVR